MTRKTRVPQSSPGRVGGGARSERERVYQALRHDILALSIAPGTVLVERGLASRFAVSKTPIREALALLQRDGLVDALPRRGYLVTPVTVRDVHELFELRAALEGAAAELAAVRITADELGALERLLTPPEIPTGREALARLLTRNRAFHTAIAHASRNGRLVAVIGQTLDEMTRLIAIGYEPGSHDVILEALRSGNGERARRAVVDHVLMTQERVLKGETRGFLRAADPSAAS
jgi:DNA-binding GntR family transcriptional regulator